VTDFPVVNVHVDKSSSARIWQYKLCATFSANVNVIHIHALCTFTTGKSVTCTGACAKEIIPNRSFFYKTKEGPHVRIYIINSIIIDFR
jgi:hypothetical protein